ncbi:hypothetical protein E3Q23_04226 [Wallemia mellicola]|uniref:DUF1365-domain-containing protein n=1 Tax=Wallemia mellicola TaxID=1708541 RepID=A0A4T0RIK2_9BASI|nr:hypothetical protein E3Q23_04226 [Wallemia mellicola]TIB79295.1 hypothetical protein E3Q21_04211 [Wallemia mellicola]TIB83367.1 hypothetical protein E3Q20_04193 [Wallemia mellicola]TIB95547.1 hypothetical protein E3Q17_04243 [Wallemia mellicola]TIC07025.1 hypothetical protein E3Q15_04293 [Wallemia mellicola]
MIETMAILLSLLAVTSFFLDFSPMQKAYYVHYRAPHRRMHPFKGTFEPRFYHSLIKLSKESNAGRLLRESSNRFSTLFRIVPTDYLTNQYSKNMSIYDNLIQTLKDRGFDTGKRAKTIYFSTLPLVFLEGSSINNISHYYCYNDKDEIEIVLWEVHNSSGDRSDQVSRKSISSEYTYCATVLRSFYISAVDNRKGFYRFSYTLPIHKTEKGTKEIQSPRSKVTLFDERMQALTTTRLIPESEPIPITFQSTIAMIFKRPLQDLSILLTLLRQVYFITIVQKVRINRNVPQGITLNRKHGMPTQSSNEAGVLGWTDEDMLASHARRVFEKALARALNESHRDLKMVIKYTDKHIPETHLETPESKTELTLLVRSWEFYKQIIVAPNADYVYNILTQRCEDLVRASDGRRFYELLRDLKTDSHSWMYTRIREWFVKLTCIKDSENNSKVNFSLSVSKNYLDDSWKTIFVAFCIFFEYKVLQLFYLIAGITPAETQVPWRPIKRLQ